MLSTVAGPGDIDGSGAPSASERMSRQRRRDTEPELRLRRELHRRGLRFRVDQPLPGVPRRRADLLFTRARVAVFVDGCFWHGCPEHRTWPSNNAAWWRAKLERNVARDSETDCRLAEDGWTVIRVWEHEDPIVAADRVADVVRERNTRQRPTPSSPVQVARSSRADPPLPGREARTDS